MRLVLPVEYGAASDLVVDAMRRCHPDVVVFVVVGFGEFNGVALERTSYNDESSADHDSRDVWQFGSPSLAGGAESVSSSLPPDALYAALGPATSPMATSSARLQRRLLLPPFIHLRPTLSFTDWQTAARDELVRVRVQTLGDASQPSSSPSRGAK